MDQHFWHERWQRKEIGFHQAEVNPLLIQYWHELGLAPGSRVLVPLCGKSLDLLWLREQGHEVVGAELSRVAVAEFFDAAGLTPTITPSISHGETLNAGLERWQADGIEIYCGDLFQLSASLLGRVDGWYDRAALVALPAAMRGPYVAHLRQLAPMARGLLITLDYPQERVAGPPFSVEPAEVAERYQRDFQLRPLASCPCDDLPPKFRQQGVAVLNERAWGLIPA